MDLTRAEIQELVIRNKAMDLGRQVLVCWTPWAKTTYQLGTEIPTNPDYDPSLTEYSGHARWEKRLNSKRWRTQPKGAKLSTLVERPVRSRDGKWSYVALNARTT